MGEYMNLHNVCKCMERKFKDIITSKTVRQVPTNQAPMTSKVELFQLNIL